MWKLVIGKDWFLCHFVRSSKAERDATTPALVPSFSPFLSLFLSFFVCTLHQGSGSYVHISPRPCFEHLSMGQACNAPTPRDAQHFVCSPCSRAHFGRATTACVSSPRRLGSLQRLAHAAGHRHFQRASTSRRSAPLFEYHSRQKTTIQKIGANFSLRHCSRKLVLQRVFPAPPGASCTVVLRKMNNSEKMCSCNLTNEYVCQRFIIKIDGYEYRERVKHIYRKTVQRTHREHHPRYPEQTALEHPTSSKTCFSRTSSGYASPKNLNNQVFSTKDITHTNLHK